MKCGYCVRIYSRTVDDFAKVVSRFGKPPIEVLWDSKLMEASQKLPCGLWFGLVWCGGVSCCGAGCESLSVNAGLLLSFLHFKIVLV